MHQPDREWIQDKLSSLTAHADELQRVGDAADEPNFGPWTALKLIVLTATVDVYTQIIHDYDFDPYYVDAMAGSGITELDGGRDTLIGSPIVAGTVAHEPFSKMFLIEQNEERAEALRDRLEFATEEIDTFTQSRDEWVVIEGDTNEELPSIPSRVRDERGGYLGGQDGQDGAHHLAFIDNERVEVEFDSLRRLSSMWGDLLINYQEKGINREIGLIESGEKDGWDEILAFFDDDAHIQRDSTPNERFELYLGKLDSINRSEYESLTIHGSDEHPYGYKMIYATRPTGGGSEYVEFMETYQRKIEALTGDDIENVLDTMKGTSTHLGLWSPDEDSQSRLGGF
ncbi:three-Cys-motif partner protein TcmP [Haloglomus halophilum]|uniref:three-Cys-motif partner protein TcmP n=1 Tax=Haloglomus halophilum TaxID=2962672 RepID=UPI0020C97AA2|nr:three-Cys-motif partner protein TcmP [Haloglomus halophilum]